MCEAHTAARMPSSGTPLAPCSGWAPSGAPTFERSPEPCMAPAGAGEMGSSERRQSSLRPTHTCEHTCTVHAHGSEGMRTSRHTHTDVHTRPSAHLSTWAEMHTCVCKTGLCTMHTHVYTHTRVHTFTLTRRHTRAHTRADAKHTKTHAHGCTHMHTRMCPQTHGVYPMLAEMQARP